MVRFSYVPSWSFAKQCPIAVLVVLTFLPFFLLSQTYSFQATAHTGKILKINPVFPEITQNSFFGEAGLVYETRGKRKWHKLYGFPEVGITLQAYSLGNPEVFGNAYGIAPHISFSLYDREFVKLQLQLANSLTFITRPHDRQTNRINNVIGTRINNGTSLRLEAIFFQYRTWQLLTGIGYYHFSNSNFSVPNLGINIPNVMVGVRHYLDIRDKPRPQPESSSEFPFDRPELIPSAKKIYPGIRLGYGITEAKVPGGPKYPAYVAAFYLNKYVGNKVRLKAGTEWFYSLGSYAYVRNYEPEVDNDQWASTAAAAFVGAEFTMRRVALVGHVGPYFKKAFQMEFTLYTKMGIQYYLYDQQVRHRGQPFIGVFVHSHSGEADFAEFAVGWVF